MDAPKKTIGKTIFFSYMEIIIIQKYITKNLDDLNFVKINKALKQTQSFLDIKYAIIKNNKKIIYPKNENSEELIFLQNQLIPFITNKYHNLNKNNFFSFKMASKKSIGKIIYLNDEYYLVVYSDFSKYRKYSSIVNLILLIILLFSLIITFMISKKVSKKISYPIIQLCKYADKVGNRQYDAEVIEYDYKEIDQLSQTMNKMAVQLSSYDSTLKTFIQNASHELRTPLMSIQGYAEGIKYNIVEDTDKAVNIIIEESKRLTDIVNVLLFLSKVDSMQEKFTSNMINIEDIIKNCIEKVEGIAVIDKKKINFCPYNYDFEITGDEEMLSRALINIISNSLRYCIKNVNINIDSNDKNVSIIVKDDGPGIDRDDLEHIFERFYKGKGGKFGLGLAISKSIIEKHSGSIIAKNNDEGGACFIITLPISK
ncbi:Signal transduction histidine kinase [Caloramator quimbayensis]|uniref:histidine kinase n=1 Tax=Caloramator quimbayensis TaxID=1147123 RepID=A0A1T4XU13_9CLOT|nr:HAMP domain-containing sensor histidine kinase [Caloramator quimbayensis]SKA93027.1 Signal transduction histidine kinase [Caloramator quimbayensis]